MFGRRRAGGLGWASLACLSWVLAGVASAQVLAPKVETVDVPPNVDVFNLSFELPPWEILSSFQVADAV